MTDRPAGGKGKAMDTKTGTALTAIIVGCSALLGCDGFLGKYGGDTDGQTGTEDDDGGGEGTPVDLPDPGDDDGQPGVDLGPGGESDGGGSDDGWKLDLEPGPGACGNSNYLCSEPWDCSEQTVPCGDPNSVFDADGCLRFDCRFHTECSEGEYCYIPQESGGCASSTVTCYETNDGTCQCDSTPDCSGGYCLPADIYPPPGANSVGAGPSIGHIEQFCAPNDALLWRFEFFSDPVACDDAAQPEISVVIGASPGTIGSFPLELEEFGEATWTDGLSVQQTTRGVLRIRDTDENAITGEYELHFDNAGLVGVTLIGTFSAAQLCPGEMGCS